MQWRNIKKEMPKIHTVFWAFLLGREEQGYTKPQHDHEIRLLYMFDYNYAVNLTGTENYHFPQKADWSELHVSQYIIAWLPVNEMIIPDFMELNPKDE